MTQMSGDEFAPHLRQPEVLHQHERNQHDERQRYDDYERGADLAQKEKEHDGNQYRTLDRGQLRIPRITGSVAERSNPTARPKTTKR
jgi:hypothetical protein